MTVIKFGYNKLRGRGLISRLRMTDIIYDIIEQLSYSTMTTAVAEAVTEVETKPIPCELTDIFLRKNEECSNALVYSIYTGLGLIVVLSFVIILMLFIFCCFVSKLREMRR